MKNKRGIQQDAHKAGKTEFKFGTFTMQLDKDPLAFANSQNFRQIQQRNRKHKRKK